MRSAGPACGAAGTVRTAPAHHLLPSPLRTSGTAPSGGSAADSAAVTASRPCRRRPASPDRPQRQTGVSIFWGRSRHGYSARGTTYRRSLWFSLSLFSFSRSKKNTSYPVQSSHRRPQKLVTRRRFVDTCAWNHFGRKKFTGDDDFSTSSTSTTYDVLSDRKCHSAEIFARPENLFVPCSASFFLSSPQRADRPPRRCRRHVCRPIRSGPQRSPYSLHPVRVAGIDDVPIPAEISQGGPDTARTRQTTAGAGVGRCSGGSASLWCRSR